MVDVILKHADNFNQFNCIYILNLDKANRLETNTKFVILNLQFGLLDENSLSKLFKQIK